MTRDGKLLLVRRAIDPWHGLWDIPGGFCEAGEHPQQTVVREVREEVGLDIVVTGMLGIWMDTYGPGVGPAPADATMNCLLLLKLIESLKRRVAALEKRTSSKALSRS